MQVVDRGLDRLKIGECPAQPAMIYIKHPGPFRLLHDHFLGLTFRSDKENIRTIRNGLCNEFECGLG